MTAAIAFKFRITATSSCPGSNEFISDDGSYGVPTGNCGFFLAGAQQHASPFFSEGFISSGVMYGSFVSSGMRIGGGSIPNAGSRDFVVDAPYQVSADQYKFVSNINSGTAKIELLDSSGNVIGTLNYSAADAATLLTVAISAVGPPPPPPPFWGGYVKSFEIDT